MMRLLSTVMFLCLTAGIAVAGPYARAAAQVQSRGGVLRVIAMGGLENQSAATLDARARGLCHMIALEGVTVTSVQIVTERGQLLRLVSGATPAGC
jgi:hypothetical protein